MAEKQDINPSIKELDDAGFPIEEDDTELFLRRYGEYEKGGFSVAAMKRIYSEYPWTKLESHFWKRLYAMEDELRLRGYNPDVARHDLDWEENVNFCAEAMSFLVGLGMDNPLVDSGLITQIPLTHGVQRCRFPRVDYHDNERADMLKTVGLVYPTAEIKSYLSEMKVSKTLVEVGDLTILLSIISHFGHAIMMSVIARMVREMRIETGWALDDDNYMEYPGPQSITLDTFQEGVENFKKNYPATMTHVAMNPNTLHGFLRDTELYDCIRLEVDPERPDGKDRFNTLCGARLVVHDAFDPTDIFLCSSPNFGYLVGEPRDVSIMSCRELTGWDLVGTNHYGVVIVDNHKCYRIHRNDE